MWFTNLGAGRAATAITPGRSRLLSAARTRELWYFLRQLFPLGQLLVWYIGFCLLVLEVGLFPQM